ncbi:MAG: transcriptional regulator [Stigonema ocellatum SAG 48.90 = DSM 106950]|nr:transcriptional regulator [Stigonema ocellatum SAG 48.90 = DSM 106950]
MTLTFDQNTYRNLLAEVVPVAIETEEEYERILKVIEELTFKKNRTKEEQVLHKLLVILIEAYETEHYPIEESAPHEILQHIMEASGTRQADLVGIIGSSTVVSEVVSGKRSISQAQAKALSEHFKVSPGLFI